MYKRLLRSLNLELSRNVLVLEFYRRLESVDYFRTTEHYRMVKKKIRILISKTAMVGCCKLSLYANGLVMSMRFIFGDD